MVWQHLFEYFLDIYFEFNGMSEIDTKENVRDLLHHLNVCRETGGVNVDSMSLAEKVELIATVPRSKFPFRRELEHYVIDWEAVVWAKGKANQLLPLVTGGKRNVVQL